MSIRHVRMLATASCLGVTVARDVLSDFERDLLGEVSLRFLAERCEAVVTAVEWAVVEQAVEAMAKALYPRVTLDLRGGHVVGVEIHASAEAA